MTNAEIRRAILEECFPEECDVVGATNVDAILAGRREFVRPRGGERLGIGEIVAGLVGAIAFVDNVLSIIDRFRKARKELLAVTQIVAVVREEFQVHADLDDATVLRVCEVTLTRVKSHDSVAD